MAKYQTCNLLCYALTYVKSKERKEGKADEEGEQTYGGRLGILIQLWMKQSERLHKPQTEWVELRAGER